MAEELALLIMQHFPERETMRHRAKELREAARERKPSVLIACMPKTGSTFLANVLASITEYPHHPLVYAHFRQEQDLYLPSLLKAIAIPTVTQQHVRATEANLELLQIFNVKPIVLVRNIFDTIVSFFDHLHKESVQVPAGYFNDEFFTFDDEKKFDMIIDVAGPWFIGFFASWQDAMAKGRCTMAWLTYEALFANLETAVSEILGFYEVTASQARIRESLQAARDHGSRFNKGVKGRGETRLTTSQKERVARLAAYYPAIDFSMIGLPKGMANPGDHDRRISA